MHVASAKYLRWLLAAMSVAAAVLGFAGLFDREVQVMFYRAPSTAVGVLAIGIAGTAVAAWLEQDR